MYRFRVLVHAGIGRFRESEVSGNGSHSFVESTDLWSHEKAIILKIHEHMLYVNSSEPRESEAATRDGLEHHLMLA